MYEVRKGVEGWGGGGGCWRIVGCLWCDAPMNLVGRGREVRRERERDGDMMDTW